MNDFFKKIWNGIKREFMMFLISTWYVWLAIIIAVIVGLIWNSATAVWTFFGLVVTVILFIWIRQAYWWFTGKVDYINGGFPKLWKKLLKR